MGVNAFAVKLTDNGNGTVTDAVAALMWQQGEGGLKAWADAIAYCGSLSLGGHSDWRLPDINELKSLIDDNFSQPKVDTTFFPKFPPTQMFYWSSTETAGNKIRAKGLIFNYGTEDDFLKKTKYYVRCVRIVQ